VCFAGRDCGFGVSFHGNPLPCIVRRAFRPFVLRRRGVTKISLLKSSVGNYDTLRGSWIRRAPKRDSAAVRCFVRLEELDKKWGRGEYMCVQRTSYQFFIKTGEGRADSPDSRGVSGKTGRDAGPSVAFVVRICRLLSSEEGEFVENHQR
jgi:hypothetical protein